MKILFAGDWSSELHEAPAAKALEALGHEVVAFAWRARFDANQSRIDFSAPSIWGRVQNKFLLGPRFSGINRSLIAAARRHRPELLFIYRGTHITAKTIRAIKRDHQAVVVGLNNDDPFAPLQPKYLWRHLLRALPDYDLMLAYRQSNIEEYSAAGARNVRLLRSWFVPERNFPAPLSPGDRARFGCDVVFVGHFEPDGRLECLEEAARRGWSVRIFGPGKGFKGFGWDAPLGRSRVLRGLAPVRLVWGEEYNKALCGAKIALCFLSKFNRDTYTRRCFEIPASGTMMLSEYSEDLVGLFQPGAEADYFRDKAEMAAKLSLYLGDEALRSRVAEAGLRRVVGDGHDIRSRMEQMMQWVADVRVETGD